MPLYACLCAIDEARLDLFASRRADHYAFLFEQQRRIRFGGPTRVAEGGRPETMIIVVEADSQSDAEAWIADEPYNAHGGFKSVAVRPWSQVIPEPAPGSLRRTLNAERATLPSGAPKLTRPPQGESPP